MLGPEQKFFKGPPGPVPSFLTSLMENEDGSMPVSRVPMGAWERVKWAVGLMTSMRGVGWNWVSSRFLLSGWQSSEAEKGREKESSRTESSFPRFLHLALSQQVRNVPPASQQPRKVFVFTQSAKFCLLYIGMDLVSSSSPFFPLALFPRWTRLSSPSTFLLTPLPFALAFGTALQLHAIPPLLHLSRLHPSKLVPRRHPHSRLRSPRWLRSSQHPVHSSQRRRGSYRVGRSEGLETSVWVWWFVEGWRFCWEVLVSRFSCPFPRSANLNAHRADLERFHL